MAIFVPRFVRQLRDVLLTAPADGEVLTYDSADAKWKNEAGGGGGGAPTTADYLVGTAQAGLSAEIVAGASPGGELGGTWAAPTVDTVHSGSSHAQAQAAAEATASAALSAHDADTTAVHGITDTSTLYLPGGTDVALADGGTGSSTAAGARANLDVPSNAEAVLDTLFDANTVLAADTDDTPAALTMGASTILARLAAGNIKAATPAELKTLLAITESDIAALSALADAGRAQYDDLLLIERAGVKDKIAVEDLFGYKIGQARRRFSFYDEFLSNVYVATSTMTQSVAGSGAGIASVAPPATNRPGVWSIETGTATTGRALYSSQDLAHGGGPLVFETAARIIALADGTEIYTATIGFNDAVVANAVDGIFFRYDLSGLGTGSAASANWQVVTASNSVRTYTTTAVAVSAGTWATFRIEINAAGTSVGFYIDNVLVATHATNIPTGTSRTTPFGYLMLKSAGTTNRRMEFDYIVVEQDFTTARG